jgi:hypothetical protein
MSPNRKSSNVRSFWTTFVRFGRPLLLLVPVLYVIVFQPRLGRMAAPIMRGGYVPILLVVPALLLGQRRAPRVT